MRSTYEKEFSDDAVCRVWRYGRSSMLRKSRNTVFHKQQFQVSYVIIRISDSSKTIHVKYKRMLLANYTD